MPPRRPLPWKETLKALAAAVAPTLKACGFRKQALRWNRETTPGFVQIIELSRVKAGDGYVGAVDVGLYDEEVARQRHPGDRPKFLHELHGQVRRAMSTFELSPEATPLLHILEDEVLPYLDAHRSRPDLLGGASLNPIDRAIALCLEGDRSAAHEILQQRFDATGAQGPHPPGRGPARPAAARDRRRPVTLPSRGGLPPPVDRGRPAGPRPLPLDDGGRRRGPCRPRRLDAVARGAPAPSARSCRTHR